MKTIVQADRSAFKHFIASESLRAPAAPEKCCHSFQNEKRADLIPKMDEASAFAEALLK